MNVAKKRTNIIPIIEDARHPHKYRMLLGALVIDLLVRHFTTSLSTGMVDVIFADVAQPDQARIVSINAQHFLKNQGHFVISIKVRLLPSISPAFTSWIRQLCMFTAVEWQCCKSQRDIKMGSSHLHFQVL